MGMCWTVFDHCMKGGQGHRRRGNKRWRAPHFPFMDCNVHTFVLQTTTFNPDWHPESGWTHSIQTHSFIIQSLPELSTWINNPPSYLITQNWISVPTGSGWRKLSAPLFWFAFASYRDRILFFSSIHPTGFQSPESHFPPCAWDVCVSPPRHAIHTWSLFPAYLRRQGLYLSAVGKSAVLQKISTLGRKKTGFSTLSGFKPVWEIYVPLLIPSPYMSVLTPVAAPLVSSEAQFTKSPHTAEGLIHRPVHPLTS